MPTLAMPMPSKKKPEKRSPGRPSGPPTKAIRLPADLVDMLVRLAELEGEGLTVAGIVDPLIRGPVVARYQRLKKAAEEIERIKRETRMGRGK